MGSVPAFAKCLTLCRTVNRKGADIMNWNDSQMAASAFAKGHGGMSLGQQWALAAMLRDDKSSKQKKQPKEKSKKPVKKP